jgi:uncharacterized protein
LQRIDGQLIYSATDLNNFLECPHLEELQRQVAFGQLNLPPADGASHLLQRKGDEHEQRYLDQLKAKGGSVLEFPARLADQSIAGLLAADHATRKAMESGLAYIYQPTFFDGVFLGRADFLRRVQDERSASTFSYEVIDTKLARSAKAYFLIQLCSYTEHLARLQDGILPRYMMVALGSGEERRFATHEYLAYYRHLRKWFLENVEALEAYPYEVEHCALCEWDPLCDERRRNDDHLSLVAWIRRDQIAKLNAGGINTVEQLAQAEAIERPSGMNPTTFDNLAHQARLQVLQRESIEAGVTGKDAYHFEILKSDPKRGFALLPERNEGDLYFDMEGDPYYASDTGLEYLFGVYIPAEDRYVPYWAHSLDEERRAVTDFLAFVMEWRENYPKMHVYHYASYEKTALGRLTTRYNTFVDEFDDLLRAEVFVDLYTVVRQGLRISQESYSIKKLEPLYDFHRSAELKRGDDSIVLFEDWLDSRDDSVLEMIRHYNDEDCRSTYHLHQWLLERREQLQHDQKLDLPWFESGASHLPSDEKRAENDQTRELREQILAGFEPPPDLAALGALSDDERLRWYVGNLIDYHRSEAKPSWWKYFDRCRNADELAEFDHECIGEITWCSEVEPFKVGRERKLTYTFCFPAQQHGLSIGSDVHDPDTMKSAGEIVMIDDESRTLQLKRWQYEDHAALRSLVPKPFDGGPQRKALTDIAQLYIGGKLQSEHPAIVDMLLATFPRMTDRQSGAPIQPATVNGQSLAEAILNLDCSYLVVQGPPGTGKSTTGGRAIVELLKAGKRVGVLARSHKAAHNLIAAVESAAVDDSYLFRGAHKFTDEEDQYKSAIGQRSFVANEKTSEGALHEQYGLVSGTPWLFASDRATGAFDVLIIDEAGQLSIADGVACARAARSVVLLGDPLQLAQVSQGKHPTGIGRSILQHLLGEHATIPENRGIFLRHSWRMHPSICSFISDAVYEGRLTPARGNEMNAIASPGLTGSGLRWRPIDHEGNRRSSNEEADAIASEVKLLMRGSYKTRTKSERPITESSILIVSPYNAQRVLIKQKLHSAGFPHVAVGTVDSFQGLQAPIVFYSMGTSSGEDLPRNMEFLFERNRFNVAVSRAQCLTVLVCSPSLLRIRCRTPEQIALVNLLCAYAQRTESEVSKAL